MICGGGLAGLTLARLLHRRLPSASVVVLDKATRPLPEATHKIGESTVEGATHWLAHTLGLQSYLAEHHLPKLGLRFFGGSGPKRFADRFEVGAPDFPPVGSAQIDRGRFENDLRALVQADGTDLAEGALITAIAPGHQGDHHRVTFRWDDDPQPRTVTGRWLIDATGFRRMLAAQLKLDAPPALEASACWWRVKGRYHPGGLVPAGRPVAADRWFSTNHVLGHGYWIWLIALASEHTSIGIVADEAMHPVVARSSFSRATQWLQTHEPELAALLADSQAEDFLALRRCYRSVTQVFSVDRWSLVGVSGLFSDPLYSSGSDLIALTASLTTRLIADDLAGTLSPDAVARCNALALRTFDLFYESHRRAYQQFHNDAVCLIKYAWDGIVYFAFPARLLLQEIAFDAPDVLDEYCALNERVIAINRAVQETLADWAAAQPHRSVQPGFYFPGRSCPTLARLAPKPAMVERKESADEFLRWQRDAVTLLAEIAAAIDQVAARAMAPTPPVQEASDAVVRELEAFVGAPWTP